MRTANLVRSLVATVVTLTLTAYAAEYNFYEQADKKGCKSLITERGQEECARVQQRKDEACNIAIDCDVDRQERLIAKYTEAKERLERGDVADADKEQLKDTVRNLKTELDNKKEAAHAGIPVAQGCVDARENVQRWFVETGIPLTERTRDDALRERKVLLERLEETQRKQADAKAKRDANPGDSSAQGEYEHATEEMRAAEKALSQFNDKFGKDVERYAERLINQYKAERESHERPLGEARNRVENCKKVDSLRY